MVEKRYQVFVSSTYDDLQEERREVMQALLELDCMPAGMELFPAANEDQWTLIKRVISDCDYYIVIVGGRYGSTHSSGPSYTEMEYRYAVEIGKPVIAFLHKNPGAIPAAKVEMDAQKAKMLEAFRELVKGKMVQFWDNPADLGSKVSRSLVKLIKQHPGIGWVRADKLPSDDVTRELFELRQYVQQLQGQLAAASSDAPRGTESLAQGDDKITIHFTFAEYGQYNIRKAGYRDEEEFTWNQLFYALSPLMIHEASDETIADALDSFVEDTALPRHRKNKQFGGPLRDYSVSDDDFQTVKVQFRALGLITKSVKNRSVKDTGTYWTLTPYGDAVMTRLRAIPKPQKANKAPEPTAPAVAVAHLKR